MEEPAEKDLRVFLATKPDKELTESNAEKLADDILHTPTNEMSKPELVGTITEMIRAIRRETFSENLPESAEERPLTRTPLEQRSRERGSSDRRRSPRQEHRRPYISPVKYPHEDARRKILRLKRQRRHHSEGFQSEKGPIHTRIAERRYSNIPRIETENHPQEEPKTWLSREPRKIKEKWVQRANGLFFNSEVCEEDEADYEDLEVISDADDANKHREYPPDEEGDAN